MGKKKRKHRYFENFIDPTEFWKNYVYKSRFAVEHPDYFYPNGITVFCGSQGSGKTLSATYYLQCLAQRFPRCVFVSNVELEWLEPERFHRYSGMHSLGQVTNGEHGVVYFLDEMHLEFNSLESKGMPVSLFQTISQQRKQRFHIVGTAQVFQRLAKPFREQIDQVVICNNLFGLDVININKICDGATIKETPDGKLTIHCKRTYFIVHGPSLYGNYDSFEVVQRLANVNGWG